MRRFKTPLNESNQIWLPLFTMPVSAGSPTPADDHVEETLDIVRLLIKRPQSTFFVKVEGDSMVDASIHAGDLLIVDRSLEARHKDIVIALVDGEFTVKVLHKTPHIRLVSQNRENPFTIDEPFTVWGVVVWIVHQAYLTF